MFIANYKFRKIAVRFCKSILNTVYRINFFEKKYTAQKKTKKNFVKKKVFFCKKNDKKHFVSAARFFHNTDLKLKSFLRIKNQHKNFNESLLTILTQYTHIS